MKITHVTGMQDILPESSRLFEDITAIFASLARSFGYELLVSPLLEHKDLYQRSAGNESDVVKKEMYELTDKSGDVLVLRPEGTASVVRAFVEHKLRTPFKIWYLTPAFRYERPQKGRFRQHHQLGLEYFGEQSATADTEVIFFVTQFLKKLKIQNYKLKINTMGDSRCRVGYLNYLKEYLDKESSYLCVDHKVRYKRNPLRVLDCKKPECKNAVLNVLPLYEFVCDDCKNHFDDLKGQLDKYLISYEVDYHLVRGFDYYTKTTFEFVSPELGPTQNALGGGGRYDELVQLLNGSPTPAIGVGIGIERLMLVSKLETNEIDIYLISDVDGNPLEILSKMSVLNKRIKFSYSKDSIVSGLKKANKANAKVAVIIGKKELNKNCAVVKDMKTSEQKSVPIDDLVNYLKGVI